MDLDAALRRPVGWWLKEADARLDAAFDRALDGTGVDRRGWQVLASLARGPATHADLVASLTPFDDAAAVGRVLDDLATRGLIASSDDGLSLTADGTAAQRELAPRVGEVRARVRDALPDDDYVTLVRLLDRLVDGLPPG